MRACACVKVSGGGVVAGIGTKAEGERQEATGVFLDKSANHKK